MYNSQSNAYQYDRPALTSSTKLIIFLVAMLENKS